MFQFFQNGTFVTQYATRWANDNCVINQEYWTIPTWLSPGTYQVNVAYEEPVSIGGAVWRTVPLPALTVTAPPAPTTPAGCTAINPGEGLLRGQTQVSCDGRFTLAMQHDGNLVLYRSGSARWASNTGGSPADRAIMQNDGNFVLYTANGAAVWATGTMQPGSKLWVQNDGNVVIYTAGMVPLWATNTVEPPPPPPPPPYDPPDGGGGDPCGRCDLPLLV